MELSRRFPVHRKSNLHTEMGVIPARKPSSEEVAGLISASRSITIAAASVFFRETQGRRDEGTIIRSLPSVTAGDGTREDNRLALSLP